MLLKGVSERGVKEITSSQLKRLQATYSTVAFYHLPLLNLERSIDPKIVTTPSYFIPLVKQYSFLFQDSQNLPLTRGNNRKNHLKPGEGPINVNHKIVIFP